MGCLWLTFIHFWSHQLSYIYHDGRQPPRPRGGEHGFPSFVNKEQGLPLLLLLFEAERREKPPCWFISWVSVLRIMVAEAFESVGSERIYSFAQRKSAAVVVKIKRNEL